MWLSVPKVAGPQARRTLRSASVTKRSGRGGYPGIYAVGSSRRRSRRKHARRRAGCLLFCSEVSAQYFRKIEAFSFDERSISFSERAMPDFIKRSLKLSKYSVALVVIRFIDPLG